jgi:hypothetical protein
MINRTRQYIMSMMSSHLYMKGEGPHHPVYIKSLPLRFILTASTICHVMDSSDDCHSISCTLKAPTASCTKNDETTVTYLNRGQPYVINISSNGPHISDYKVNEHQFNYHGLSMVFPVLFGKQYCWFSIP